jgi:hypothetical protein
MGHVGRDIHRSHVRRAKKSIEGALSQIAHILAPRVLATPCGT